MRASICNSWRPIWREVPAQRSGRSPVGRAALAFAIVLTAFVTPLAPAFAQSRELPVPERCSDEVREAVRDVLRRPEYRRDAPTIIERARRWLGDQFSRLLTSLFRGDRGTVLGWAILGGLAALIVVLSIRFAGGVTPDPARRIAVPTVPRRSPAEWRDEADAHERAGDWRLALRARYRALVGDLAAAGLLDDVPGRTAGEYRVDVAAAAPRVGAEFAGATELFERAWYGHDPTGAADTAQFRELERRVLTGAGA
jgi:hypothetical protein